MKNKIHTLKTKFRCAAILTLAAGLGFCTCASASTSVVWTKAGSDQNWTTNANWSTGAYPNGDYNVSNNVATSAVMPTTTISINEWNPNSAYSWSNNMGTGSVYNIATANVNGNSQYIRGNGVLNVGTLNMVSGNFLTFNGSYNASSIGSVNIGAINLTAGNIQLGASTTVSSLGVVNFIGTGGKQLILITSYASTRGYSQTTTLSGLSSSEGSTNAVLSGGNGAAGYTNYSTASLNITSGVSYASNVALKDGNNTVLVLDKYGAGTQVLTGSTSTYTGGTYVHEGALLVGNSAGSGVGYGNVTVSGGTFGGNGRVALNAGNAVTVDNGATLLAGDGVNAGALTLVGTNLTMATGSEIAFLLQEAANASLVRSGSGTWTFDADQIIRFIDDGAAVGQTYTLITGLGAAVDVSGWDVANADWNGVFEYNSGAVTCTLTSIPEPAAAALALSACFGWAVLVRCRRRV